MANTKIKIEFDAMKKDALEFYAKEKGIDIATLLQVKLDDLYQEHVPDQAKKFVNHLSGEANVEEEVTQSSTKRKNKSLTQKAQESPVINDVPVVESEMTLSQ